MNYIEYLQKRYNNFSARELALLQLQTAMMLKSTEQGIKLLAENYQTAINLILKSKDMEYMKKFSSLKRLLYEQKCIY